MPPHILAQSQAQLVAILVGLESCGTIAKMKADEFREVRRHVHRPIENSARLASLESQDLVDVAEVGSTQRPQGSLVVGGPVPTVEEGIALSHQLRSVRAWRWGLQGSSVLAPESGE